MSLNRLEIEPYRCQESRRGFACEIGIDYRGSIAVASVRCARGMNARLILTVIAPRACEPAGLPRLVKLAISRI
jgi:hypothetical protein